MNDIDKIYMDAKFEANFPKKCINGEKVIVGIVGECECSEKFLYSSIEIQSFYWRKVGVNCLFDVAIISGQSVNRLVKTDSKFVFGFDSKIKEFNSESELFEMIDGLFVIGNSKELQNKFKLKFPNKPCLEFEV